MLHTEVVKDSNCDNEETLVAYPLTFASLRISIKVELKKNKTRCRGMGEDYAS